uniref:dynactin subunit 1 isoform X2 n=1 Tax=Ciona intestinalis TaxID=7719 RepID=UPI00089DA8FF|nr:dynactin subunit 1 isoform X2 [Ciona intestinalis]|eukprot:XP_018673000.1 dynactin subunit 1 isoform X2 [Ciona intestinalis]
MAENLPIKVGAKVEIVGKGLTGVISYIGTTMFASGKWIGVTLDGALGKNDGEVQGKRYFTCDPSCGVFVRQGQIQVLQAATPPVAKKTGESMLPTSLKRVSQREPRSSSPSRQSRLQTPSSLAQPRAGSRLSFAPKQEQLPETPKPAQISKPAPEPVPVREPSPPPPTTPAPFSSSNFVPGISMMEIDSLKASVKEWKEKYETIRIKRQEDRGKLKEYEKIRIQFQQLTDVKTRMSDQIQDQAKQIREIKKELQETVEDKARYVDEMSDVHETVEMATLDKEMAEEKVESMQREIEALTDKVEELQTDLEIMKAEIEESGTDGAASTYQVKQMEEQNNKLKEALVRMRDLSTAEKAEYHNLEKQMEKKNKELKEITQKKDKLAAALEVAESTVDELKEQVDIAQGAEEMVETLTEKNLEQEEKIADMLEQIHDLELINEMNEELQENARDLELELREESDMMRSKVREIERKLLASSDVVGDYQDTIQKFRKLVQELQDANHELRSSQSEQEERSDAESQSSQPPSFNYQIKMVETKAAARSIDHELRKLDVSQATNHAKLLLMYMPDMFNRRAGDNDCVQVLLLVERISCKAHIIAELITEKFELNSTPSDVGGTLGEQLTFASSAVLHLTQLQILLDKYNEALGICSVELFQKVGTLYHEMAPHERILDHLADLLRKDTLDESTNMEPLFKAIQFFQHLFNVHMKSEAFDCTTLLQQHLTQTQASISAVSINTNRIKSLLQVGQETSDVAILLKDLGTSCDDIRQFCKKIRHRMPQSSSSINVSTRLDFDDSVKSRLSESLTNISQVYELTKKWVMECGKLNRINDTSPIATPAMQGALDKAALTVYEDQPVYEAARLSLGNVMATMNAMVTAMQEGEYDSTNPPAKVVPPVEKRAEVVKSDMMDSNGLVKQIEDKDILIADLRKAVRVKTEDMSEAKIRIGILERKLEKAGKEGNDKASLIQLKLDSLTEDMKKKEKEYDETLDALQNDIDTLEREKTELKARLASQAKKSVFSDLGMKPIGLGAASPGTSSGVASILAAASTGSPAPAAVHDSPMLTQQIHALQIALRAKNSECSRLMGRKIVQELKTLSPLTLPSNDKVPKEVHKMGSQLAKLSTDLTKLAITPIIDISNRKPGPYPVGSHSPLEALKDQKLQLKLAEAKVHEIALKTQHVLSLKKNMQLRSQLHDFSSPALINELSATTPKLIGTINHSNLDVNSKHIMMNEEQFEKLNSLIGNRSIVSCR